MGLLDWIALASSVPSGKDTDEGFKSMGNFSYARGKLKPEWYCQGSKLGSKFSAVATENSGVDFIQLSSGSVCKS